MPVKRVGRTWKASDAPVVLQDLPELRPAAAVAEAPARAGGGAGLQRLARGTHGPRGAAAPGRQPGFRVQAQTNHTPQPNSRASSRSSGRQSRLPPPSYDQLARDIEAA